MIELKHIDTERLFLKGKCAIIETITVNGKEVTFHNKVLTGIGKKSLSLDEFKAANWFIKNPLDIKSSIVE